MQLCEWVWNTESWVLLGAHARNTQVARVYVLGRNGVVLCDLCGGVV